jgi:hypothetical protein
VVVVRRLVVPGVLVVVRVRAAMQVVGSVAVLAVAVAVAVRMGMGMRVLVRVRVGVRVRVVQVPVPVPVLVLVHVFVRVLVQVIVDVAGGAGRLVVRHGRFRQGIVNAQANRPRRPAASGSYPGGPPCEAGRPRASRQRCGRT